MNHVPCIVGVADKYMSSRLAVAGADFGLHLLTKSATATESIMPFGGGLSGHHGKVNDMSFCGGRGEDSHRYVATVSGKCVLFTHGINLNQPSRR